MCHQTEAAFKQHNGHPVGKKSDSIPKSLFEAGSERAKSGNTVICQTCHEIHGAKNDKLLVIDNKSSELCRACHPKKESLIQTKHDFRVSLPEAKNAKGQVPAESGPCGACHLPHNGSGRGLMLKKCSRKRRNQQAADSHCI